MLRFTRKWARRTLPTNDYVNLSDIHISIKKNSGLRAQLERERRAKQFRRGERVRLTHRERWMAVLLLLLILLACAVGGWLGMHFHHHESPPSLRYPFRANAL